MKQKLLIIIVVRNTVNTTHRRLPFLMLHTWKREVRDEKLIWVTMMNNSILNLKTSFKKRKISKKRMNIRLKWWNLVQTCLLLYSMLCELNIKRNASSRKMKLQNSFSKVSSLFLYRELSVTSYSILERLVKIWNSDLRSQLTWLCSLQTWFFISVVFLQSAMVFTCVASSSTTARNSKIHWVPSSWAFHFV